MMSYGPVGVARALRSSPSTGEHLLSLNGFVLALKPCSDAEPTLFKQEFSLADRVALVTGGNRGIGLEMALALVEAGTRIVYCVDLPEKPGDEFAKVREYASSLKGTGGDARLEYISANVTDQVRSSPRVCPHYVQVASKLCNYYRTRCGRLGRQWETGRAGWTFVSPRRASCGAIPLA